MKRLLCLLVVLFSASSVRAADYDDLYLMGWAGVRTSSGFQFGAGAGYVFVDTFGIGAVYEQQGANITGQGEIRWFLEPFESAIGFGIEERDSSGFTPILSLSGDYLYAITSSLALRAQVKWMIPLKYSAGVFTGAGFRVLF